MTKLIVRTTGAFNLLLSNGDFIRWNKSCIVNRSSMIQEHIAQGAIEVLIDNVPEHANDEDFQAFVKDSKDLDSAAANYFSTLEKGVNDGDSSKETASSKASKNTKGQTSKTKKAVAKK